MSLLSFIKFFFKRGINQSTKKHIRVLVRQINSRLDYEEKKNLIIKLDSALGLALSDLYGKNSLGINLKKAKNRFSKDTYNRVWQAHKIRNKLIHEPTISFSEEELNKSLLSFKKALMELKSY